MIEHPRLPTCHLYDVPRSVADGLCQLADLCYHHHPRHRGFAHTHGLATLMQALHVQMETSLTATPSQQQEQVITSLLEVLAARGSHTVYVVQPFNQLEEVFLCLIDNRHQSQVAKLTSRFGECPPRT